MINRLSIYIKEMFPLGIYIPFAFVNHYVLFFTVQLLLGYGLLKATAYSLIGVVTIIGFMFIMRIFDEFKDEEVDARLFPNRPYPRGAVLKKDLWFAFGFTFMFVALLNAYKSYTLPFFVGCVLYGWLTYKWFFLKKYIQPSLLLALVSHNPITVLINFYVIATAMIQIEMIHWTSPVLLSAISFYLPVLAWELARKIKPLGAENDYVTYSKIFGPRLAAVLVLLVVAAFLLSLYYYSYLFLMPLWSRVGIGLVLLGTALVVGRFVLKPIEKNLKLKSTAELSCSIASVIYLIALIAHFGITFV